jgi:very-short-patch-repair endonuclease
MIKAEVEGLVRAAESRGLVTGKEARAFLKPAQLRTRLETGAWVRVFPSVYRVVGAPANWRQSVEALMLWAHAKDVLSHRTAAVLHGFKQFQEGPLELTSIQATRPPKGVQLYRVSALLKADRTTVDELNVTSVDRTLVDLAAITDISTLRTTMDQALREKKTTLEKLEKVAARSPHRVGVIEFRQLVDEFNGAGGPSESELERLALELIEEGGLPRPKIQWTVIAGRKRRRLDLIFEKYGIVIEVDGYASHSGVEAFEDDRERNNSLLLLNLRVLHWTWRAIHERREELLSQLFAILNQPR